jgi:hypothetical protein
LALGYVSHVNEEAVIKRVVRELRTALRKKYPDRVDDVRFALGTDKDGEAAVFVTVVLKDLRTGDYRWVDVQPVEQTIRQELLDKDPFRFPYVGFELASERAAASQRRARSIFTAFSRNCFPASASKAGASASATCT